jgi:hypothetical protein
MSGIGRGYTIGLAVSDGGDLLVSVTDGPQGMNGRVFRSADGGRTFERIVAEPLPDAPPRATVPFFEGTVPWLGGYDGRLLRGGETWEEVAALPAPINTIASEGRTSSVMH